MCAQLWLVGWRGERTEGNERERVLLLGMVAEEKLGVRRSWEAVATGNMPRNTPRNSRGKRRHACTFATKETVRKPPKKARASHHL